MDLVAFDALLLFALSIPVVMHYRILPVEGTPYWLFGLLFAILTGNILISFNSFFSKRIKLLSTFKSLFLWAALTIVIVGVMLTAIVDRSKTAPVYGVHDIILQQEAAMRYLLQGKNPYKETYFGTPLEQWSYGELGKSAVNPALYHFVMPPWYLLFPFAFYFVSIPLFGFFDGRIALVFCMVGLLIVLRRWFRDHQLGSLAMILTALSPATVSYLIEGRSDIFALFWLVWSLYLLEKRKFLWSAVIFGLALASKQTIWFVAPFYLIFAWVQKKSFAKLLPMILLLGAVVVILIGPFLIWDAKAFLDSAIFYLSGNTTGGYPVSGYGLSMVFYEFGIIKDTHAYYPFILWQALFGLPVLIILLRWLMKKTTMSRLLISYAMLLLIIWYLSRYFNNSHIAYISSIFALGVLKQNDEKDP